MTLLTYKKNRTIFEQRYFELSENFGGVNLYDLKFGIRNFILFLNIYSYDRKPHFSNIVNSIDRRKRFYVNGNPVLKIKILTDKSMIDKFPKQYDKLLIHLLKTTNHDYHQQRHRHRTA